MLWPDSWDSCARLPTCTRTLASLFCLETYSRARLYGWEPLSSAKCASQRSKDDEWIMFWQYKTRCGLHAPANTPWFQAVPHADGLLPCAGGVSMQLFTEGWKRWRVHRKSKPLQFEGMQLLAVSLDDEEQGGDHHVWPAVRISPGNTTADNNALLQKVQKSKKGNKVLYGQVPTEGKARLRKNMDTYSYFVHSHTLSSL